MEEKNVGLRHMMHLFGLNSVTYWIGMFIADMLIVAIPAVVCVMMLLVFDDIMDREFTGEFFLLLWVYGCTLNVFSYAFSHIFKDPDTGIKYISMIYSVGFFLGPLVGWLIIGGIIAAGKDDGELIADGFSFFYFFSPLFTFWISTYNITVRDNEILEEWPIYDNIVNGWWGIGIMMVHIIVVFSIVIFVDYKIRNSYKSQGGFVGEEPSILPPKDDVL